MKNTPAPILLTLIILANSSPAQSAEPVTLQYKMQPDQPLIYRTVTSLDQTQIINNDSDQKSQTKMTTEDISIRTLQKIDEKGNFEIQSENKRLHVNVNIARLGKYEFDSKALEHDKGSGLGQALTPLYSSLSGAYLTFVHTPQGELKSIKGYQELLQGVIKDNPLAERFTGGGSNEAAILSFSEQFALFKKKAVSPGDKWEIPFELKIPKLGKAKGKKIFTYEGLDKVGKRETAKLSVSFELSFDLDIDMNNVQANGNFSTENSSGTIQFDLEKGQLVSLKTEYTLVGNITVTAGDNMIPIEFKRKQSTTVNLLDKLPE